MKTAERPPHDALDRLFHEPRRFAIVSALCAADAGLSFTELKETCGLTDGNLNRHLRVLESAGALRIHKTFVGLRPRTTATLTRAGLSRFNAYLDALSDVLQAARNALPERAAAPASARPAPAHA